MDSVAFIAFLIGVFGSMVLVLRHKKIIRYLVQNFKLATDRRYCTKIALSTVRPDFYYQNSDRFDLNDLNQHEQAVEFTKPLLHGSIKAEYMATLGMTIVKFALWFIVPLVFFALLGYGTVFLSSLFIGIIFSSILMYITAGNTKRTRWVNYSIVIRHIYAIDAERFSNSANHLVSSEHIYDAPLYIDNSTKWSRATQSRNVLSKYITPFLDSPFTWEKVWWLNDVALCGLLVLFYSLTAARSSSDIVYGSLYIILVSQLFFVLTWLTIKITLRLLAKYH